MFSQTSIILAAALLLPATLTQAQTTFKVGPRVGLNLATAPFEDKVRTYDTKRQAGLEAGVSINLSFGHLAVQSSLLYSQKGFQIKDSYQSEYGTGTLTAILDEKYKLNYLAVPINLIYSFGRNGREDQGVQLFAGPYVGVLMGGKYTYNDKQVLRYMGDVSTTTNKIEGEVDAGKYYSNSRSDRKFYSRGFDYGLQGGLGYRLGNAQLQLGYSLGLPNLGADFETSRGSYPGPTYANRVVQASFSYLFGE